jgi:hypothetical protein
MESVRAVRQKIPQFQYVQETEKPPEGNNAGSSGLPVKE